MTPVLMTTILLKESNKFKLQLKSLLIKRDKLEFHRDIYNYPVKFLD